MKTFLEFMLENTSMSVGFVTPPNMVAGAPSQFSSDSQYAPGENKIAKVIGGKRKKKNVLRRKLVREGSIKDTFGLRTHAPKIESPEERDARLSAWKKANADFSDDSSTEVSEHDEELILGMTEDWIELEDREAVLIPLRSALEQMIVRKKEFDDISKACRYVRKVLYMMSSQSENFSSINKYRMKKLCEESSTFEQLHEALVNFKIQFDRAAEKAAKKTSPNPFSSSIQVRR